MRKPNWNRCPSFEEFQGPEHVLGDFDVGVVSLSTLIFSSHVCLERKSSGCGARLGWTEKLEPLQSFAAIAEELLRPSRFVQTARCCSKTPFRHALGIATAGVWSVHGLAPAFPACPTFRRAFCGTHRLGLSPLPLAFPNEVVPRFCALERKDPRFQTHRQAPCSILHRVLYRITAATRYFLSCLLLSGHGVLYIPRAANITNKVQMCLGMNKLLSGAAAKNFVSIGASSI